MNKNHENKLTMYLAVASVLDANAALTAAIPALSPAIGGFLRAVNAIKEKSKEFDLVATGKTVAKLEAEEFLLDELMPAVHAAFAYGNVAGETVLAEKVNVSESTIRNLRDTEIIVKANGLLDVISSAVQNLADYGVTPETVTAIRTKIDAYELALETKESSYSVRTSANQALHEAFDAADLILNTRIDPLMEQFRKKEPEFYNAYTQARWIKSLGGGHKTKTAAAAGTSTLEQVPGTGTAASTGLH
jgi:hypothetical protein